MTTFKVEIPEEHFHNFSREILAEVDGIIMYYMAHGSEVFFDRSFDRNIMVFEGENLPGEVVAALTAIALLHPLDDIIDNIYTRIGQNLEKEFLQ
jgi:hypothetical protein